MIIKNNKKINKIEQIGSKIKSKAKKLTGISFCAAYAIQEDRCVDRVTELQLTT